MTGPSWKQRAALGTTVVSLGAASLQFLHAPLEQVWIARFTYASPRLSVVHALHSQGYPVSSKFQQLAVQISHHNSVPSLRFIAESSVQPSFT